MKSFAKPLLPVFCAALALPLQFPLHAQTAAPTLPGGGKPPPEITPRPSVAPTPVPSLAAPPRPAPTISPTPRATPSPADSAAAEPRASVDALPPADVQEALRLLKENFVRPGAFTEPEMARATLQGLIERIAPGASLVAPASQKAEPSPFYSEIAGQRAGYLRLGDLSKENVAELDAALGNLREKSIKSAILDLRATPASSDFELAADVAKRFCAKGKPLFVLKKSNAEGEPGRLFTSNADPAFRGLLVVLVDDSDAGAAEVIAAVLRAQAGALIVGEKTVGRAFEFAELPLPSGATLRVAVAEVTLPDGAPLAQGGVKPDIEVKMPDAMKSELFRVAREKGIAATLAEPDRIRMNEAALVAGRNPEIDAIQAAQQRGKSGEKPKPPLLDTQLERAMDLITSISVFEAKRAGK